MLRDMRHGNAARKDYASFGRDGRIANIRMRAMQSCRHSGAKQKINAAIGSGNTSAVKRRWMSCRKKAASYYISAM